MDNKKIRIEELFFIAHCFQVRVDGIIEKVDDYAQQMKPVSFFVQLEESLVLISQIEKISLEVEMSYNDVEERCR